MVTLTKTPPQIQTWGHHLWDKSEEVFVHTSLDNAVLTNCYAKFYKELGEVEKDYAKGVRKLCNKYAPKQDVGGNETNRDKCFRLFLVEMGYKAGQHEILSELYSKSIPDDLKTKVKEVNKEIERLRKELKRSQEVTEHVQKSQEKYNIKYQKSYQDAVFAERSWQRAETDSSMSRREVDKLRNIAVEKQKQCDESRRVLDRHSSKLQDVSNNHLHQTLPMILDSLQNINIDTGKYICKSLNTGISAEMDGEKVITACSREMVQIIDQVDPAADSERVIEIYKSGAVPSVETLGHAIVDTNHLKHNTNTIKKSKSFQKIPSDKESQSVYQNKRKLEQKIESLEEEITKGQKEMSALQLMVRSYTENPQFGDVNKFKSELDKVTHHVQQLESNLYSLNSQLRDVSSKLPRESKDTCDSYTCSDRSDTQSQSSGYPSSASSGDMDSQFGETCSTRDSHCEDTCSARGSQYSDSDSYKDTIQSLLTNSPGYCKPIQIPPTANAPSDADVLNSFLSPTENFQTEELPPPPAEMLDDTIDQGDDVTDGPVSIVTAMYNFDVITDGNISMTEGEQFYKTGEDDGGWIRVRRINGEEEGFVPTAFLEQYNTKC